MIKHFRKFIPVLIIMLFSNLVFAQFRYKINLSTGYYKTLQTGIQKRDGITAAFEGTAGYKYENDANFAQVELKFKPEFYGLSSSLKILNFIGSANYHHQQKTFSWGINVNRQQFNYKNSAIDILYDRFILNADILFTISKKLPVNFSAGYAFQKVSDMGMQRLDMLFAEAKIYKSLLKYLNSGLGLYLEKFDLTSDFVLPDSNNNKGLRFGPEVSINYLKDFVFRLNYKFLFHQSEYINSLSYAQWVRILAGKFLTKNLSAFLLGDYYFRNFKVKSVAEKYKTLLYTSANFENRVYIKLGYDVSENYELYLKSGYFKENIFDSQYYFEGWNILLGVEFGN